MTKKVLKPILLGTVSAFVFALPAAAQSADEMETVTVTGYRASLEKALEIKRDTVGVRDSIVAEDIGKYPATNIAESLTRVPGVVIARDTRTDEGRQVTVRGLASNYTIVTINGNPVHVETANNVGSNSRSVDLDAFGPDLFSRVDFYKSPNARLDEGGIGGVIDMRTPHPFDYDGRKITYSLGYGLNTFREKAVPGASFQVSNTWGPVGVLLAVTAKRSSYAIFGSEAAGWGQACNENGSNTNSIYYDFGPGKSAVCGTTTYPGQDSRASIGSLTVDQIQQAFVPRWVRSHMELDDRTRYSGLLSLQYKPNEKLDIAFDLMSSLLTDHRNDFTIGTFIRGTSTTAAGYAAAVGDDTRIGKSGDSGLVPISVGIDSNNNLYGTFSNMAVQSGNVWYMGKDKFLSGTLSGKYQPTDDLTFTAVASIADYRGFYSQNGLSAYIYNTTGTYDPRSNYKFSQFTVDADVTDPSLYQGSTVGSKNGFDVDANYWKEGDRVMTGKASAVYAFESGLSVLGHVDIEAGTSWVSTQKTNDKKSNASLVKSTTITKGVLAGYTLASVVPGDYMIDHTKLTNFLDDVKHAERPTQWATVPDSVYWSVGFNDILAKDTSQYSSVYKVTEAVTSFYLNGSSNGELFGNAFKIDAGLRFARTQMYGFNYGSSKDSSGTTVYTKTPIHNSYDSILPTISLSYDILEDLVARAAYGRTITRASLGNIAQATNVPSRFNNAASAGNPKLKPLIANNIDFGLEWYFDKESVLSVGLFYKGLKNLISSQTTTVAWSTLGLPDTALADIWHEGGLLANPVDPDLSMTLTRPVNLNPMVVKGVEVFYQQPFTFLPDPFDGLGAMASFTYTAGTQSGTGTGFTANDGTVYRMQLVGLSTYSYSATAYYEKDDVSLRLSYSWRSKTPGDTSNYYSTNLRQWVQARGSLDATLGYTFSDWAEVRLDASNLLNEHEIVFLADQTGKNSKIGSRYSGAGDGTSRVNYDYVHGVNYMISIRGHF